MRRIVRQLADVAGVRGCLVVTHDGIVAASQLARQLDVDVVAAMAAHVIRTTRAAFERAALGRFARFTLVATHGKMVFADTGPAFLVVVTDRNAEIGPVEIEIESAAMRIRNIGEIRV
jgi:predicted regulator of Ras-like GTPase activity (Roadblock/LC7/MglB family)